MMDGGRSPSWGSASAKDCARSWKVSQAATAWQQMFGTCLIRLALKSLVVGGYISDPTQLAPSVRNLASCPRLQQPLRNLVYSLLHSQECSFLLQLAFCAPCPPSVPVLPRFPREARLGTQSRIQDTPLPWAMSVAHHHDPEATTPSLARIDSRKSKAASTVDVDTQDLDYDSPARPVGALPVPPADTKGLHRALSARQVSMIAIAGTIGTGLFLGTGRSLAQGGPASILLCYGIIGFIVYITLLLLGEMATQYPVAGEFYSLHPYRMLLCTRVPGGRTCEMGHVTNPSFFRFLQRICYPVLLSLVRLRSFMELLVQRRDLRRV